MKIVINSLDPSVISEKFRNTEVETIGGIFDIQDYKSGTEIARSDDICILTNGSIKVKLNNIVGESTVQILNPGDILKLGDLAGIPASYSCSPSLQQTRLYAADDTKVLCMSRAEIESTGKFKSVSLYYVIHGLATSVHDILKSMKHQYVEIRNYFYRVNGLY